jgi:hypothetical protein
MPQDAGKITLIRTSTGWCAKFSGDAAVPIRSAFGTDTIPTAYTAFASAEKVKKEIRYMWPRCIVEVER